MNLKNIAIKTATVLIIATPLLAAAIANTSPIQNLDDVTSAVERVVTWMITLFWVLAVAFIVWAAFLYLTGGGDEEKIKTAKSKLIYAIVAAAIALLATGVQAIVLNLLQP